MSVDQGREAPARAQNCGITVYISELFTGARIAYLIIATGRQALYASMD